MKNRTKKNARSTKRTKIIDGQKDTRDASSCLGATQVSVRLVPVQDSFGWSTGKASWCRLFLESNY